MSAEFEEAFLKRPDVLGLLSFTFAALSPSTLVDWKDAELS